MLESYLPMLVYDITVFVDEVTFLVDSLSTAINKITVFIFV